MTDITITAANVRPLPGAIVQRFIASAAIDVGAVVYKGATTTQVTEADASAAATAKACGIVVSAPNGKSAAAAGEPVGVVVFGPVTGAASMTPGNTLYVSVTTGVVADAAPAATNYEYTVGWAMSATEIFVSPGFDPLPTVTS